MPKSELPIKLTMYGEVDGVSDEVIRDLHRSIIPWGILKRAVRFAKSVQLDDSGVLDISQLSDENIDEMAAIVAAVFEDDVSVEQLDRHADLEEMMAVIEQIMARAGSITNPTRRGGK